MDIIAHRGASTVAPENTIAAIDAAVEYRADAIEVDAQLTKDGQLVLFHDCTIERTTDSTGRIADLTLAEIRRLDAGSWFGSEYRGTRIPTLGEAIRHSAIPLLVELSPCVQYRYGVELPTAICSALSDAAPGTAVQSFVPLHCRRLRALLPLVPIALLSTRAPHDHELAEMREFADAVNLPAEQVDADTIERIHRHELGVFAWTVGAVRSGAEPGSTARDLCHFRDIGVDGVVADQWW